MSLLKKLRFIKRPSLLNLYINLLYRRGSQSPHLVRSVRPLPRTHQALLNVGVGVQEVDVWDFVRVGGDKVAVERDFIARD